MADYNELLDTSDPTRIAAPAGDVSVPGWGEARGAAEALGQKLYKGPEYTGAVESKEAALQELYNYDKQMEQRGATSPTAGMAQSMYGPGYVPHYGDIMAGAGRYAGGVGGVVGTAQRALSQVSGEYEMSMSNVMGKFLDFFKLREQRLEREAAAKRDKEKTLLSVIMEAGGDWTDPDTGTTHHFQTPEEKAALTAKYREPSYTERKAEESEKLLDQLTEDARNYATLEQVMRKYGTSIDPGEIARIYALNSPWSRERVAAGKTPLVESPEQLYQRYGIVPPARAPEVGITSGSYVEQIKQLPTSAERTGARQVLNILNAVDGAIALSEGTGTGPLSALASILGEKAGKVGRLSNLRPALKEILREIRKETTGVAFSQQEIEQLLKEVPSVTDQEAIVKTRLDRIRGRMINKLANYGIGSEWEVLEP